MRQWGWLWIFSTLWTLLVVVHANSPWINYPDSGFASLTHYTIPPNFIPSCGCTPGSSQYPTAALSQMAFGSSMAYGPGCGRCFTLTLLNTFLSTPPFFPNVTKSIVVKVTDLCPISSNWCGAKIGKPNKAGNLLNFDLSWPSTSVPDDFFPSDPQVYGYSDFGVWNISYVSVSCDGNWAGFASASAIGTVPVETFGSGVCCPADPTVNSNTACGSFSDLNDIPPEAAPGTSSATSAQLSHHTILMTLISVFVILLS